VRLPLLARSQRRHALPMRRVPTVLLALVACLAAYLAARPRTAIAANPQPYKIDWVSSGHDDVDDLLQATSQLQQLRKSAPVDPFGLIARARGDVSRLETVLKSFGYYDGSITIMIEGMGLDSPGLADSLTKLSKSTGAHVKITPTLGPLFHIGRIEFQGAVPEGMERQLDLSTGDPAVAADVLAAGTKLQSLLTDAGYAFATVDKPVAYRDPPHHILNLTYRVMAGPRVKIGKIDLQGLKDVNESLVRRRLLIHTGELYDAQSVEKARQDLLQLGVFSSVSVRLGKAPDAEGHVPITFSFAESKSHTFGVSAAYSSDLGGSGGVNWSDRNLLGGAQQLAFSASAINLGGTASTGIGYDTTLGYTIPDFHRRDQSLHLSVQALRQELQAYAENGQLAGAILSRRLSSVWSISGGLSYEHELIGQPGATCPPPPGTEPKNVGGIVVCPFSEVRTYELFFVPLVGLYDSTNLASPLDDPTHGYRITLNFAPTFSYGQAGTFFLVAQATAATYLDLHKLFPGIPNGRTVIAAKVMGGFAQGALWNNLPPDQRFYAGGSGTIRGYRYQSVGPQFTTTYVPQGGTEPVTVPSGVPEGGTTLQIANLELRQRIGTNFGFVIFADGGGISQKPIPFSGAYRIGVGAGVRYYTPIGPIRFDIAVPTKRNANDDRFEIYIGLGQAF